jgi:general secretion pathway protein G
MNKGKKRSIRSGFTMVELMAVLIILGLLATVVVKNFVGKVADSKVTVTKANLKILHSAVNEFFMTTGRYPTESEGLQALLNRPSDVTKWPTGGFLDTTSIPKDGWGRDFIYRLSPESGKAFVIISLGADGQEGGEDDNADLKSTDAQ